MRNVVLHATNRTSLDQLWHCEIPNSSREMNEHWRNSSSFVWARLHKEKFLDLVLFAIYSPLKPRLATITALFRHRVKPGVAKYEKTRNRSFVNGN